MKNTGKLVSPEERGKIEDEVKAVVADYLVPIRFGE